MISHMIQKAKTNPFEKATGQLDPLIWGLKYEDSSKYEWWSPGGVWTVLIPAILQQDVWPFEHDFQPHENWFYWSLKSALFYGLLPMMRHVGAISVEDLDENGRSELSKALDKLLSERIPSLKLIFVKWSLHSAEWQYEGGQHMLEVYSEDIRPWAWAAETYEPKTFAKLETAISELFLVILQKCIDSSAATTFGSKTEGLFNRVHGKRLGWPPKSRIAPKIVDALNKCNMSDDDTFTLGKGIVNPEELRRTVQKICAVGRSTSEIHKRSKRIPLLGSIATFSLPRLADDRGCGRVCVSLSETVDPVIKDIHDEIEEAEPLDITHWVGELSFDSPSEISITLFQEYSMAVGWDMYRGHYKSYQLRDENWSDTLEALDEAWAESPIIISDFDAQEDAKDSHTSQGAERKIPGAWHDDDGTRG